MENQVEEIKKKLDAVEVIQRFIPLKKRGRHFVACCPFHGEKTPSFIVSPELQIFKCFGCGKSGDIFTFVQEFNRLSFREALEDLAKMAGITLVHSQKLTEEETKRKRLLEINHELSKFYHYILTSHPLGKNALDYVLNRGITSDTIKKFRIGFSPANASLASNYLLKKGFKVGELIDTGTFGQSQYHRGQLYDRFQDRLVFPIIDFRDRILAFSGRILPTSRNPDLAKYINSPETAIYHKSQTLFGINLSRDAIKKSNSVIVTEGEFDMISPFQAGIENIVAIKGTAFTSDQLQLLRRYTDTLILGLDSDFAGNNAARKSIELADSLEFDIKVITLGDKFKDPDEAVRGDLEFFKKQAENPIPVWDFIINSAVKSNDSTTIRGKKAILSIVLPFLGKIHNTVIRSDYLSKLAAEIGSSVTAVTEEFAKLSLGDSQKVSPVEAKEESVNTSKTEKLEQYLLALVFSAKKPQVLIQKVTRKISFTVPRFQKIVSELSNVTDFDPSTFTDSLSPELHSTYQQLYLLSSNITFEPPHRRLEIQKVINQILTITYKDQLQSLGIQIGQAESSGNDTLVSELEKVYNQTLSLLSALQSLKR